MERVDTKMDALFWLSTFAAALLLGFAGNAWYGADRVPAVWWACAGAVLVVIALFSKLHLYVQENLAQPLIELAGPPAPSHFRWDPTENLVPSFKAPADDVMSGQSVSPRFKISNSAPVFTADLSLEWSAPHIDADQLAKSDPQFAKYVKDVSAGRYTLLVPIAGSSQTTTLNVQASTKETLNIPFLNRSVDTWMPIGVLWRGFMLFFARLPESAGKEVFSMEFPVTVTWNIPQRGKAQRWVVEARVQNTKRQGDQALMDADVQFSVKSIEH